MSVGTELRLSALQGSIKDMSTEVRALRNRGDQSTSAWLWLAGWLVAAGIALLWKTTAARRRPQMEPTHSDEVIWSELVSR